MRISKLLIVRVGEAGCIPKGYGLAYWDYIMDEGIFYLIPFNLLVRFYLRLYWTIAMGFYPNWFERRLQSEYERGRNETWKGSYERGLEDGIKRGYAKRQKEIDNFLDAYFAVPIEERSKWLDEEKRSRK